MNGLIELHRDNLQRAIDYLKFAETKNGAAIAFASAIVLTLIQFRAGVDNLNVFEILGMISSLCGGLVSARSFVPQLNWSRSTTSIPSGARNLLFFQDAAKFTAEEFQSEFAKRYGDPDVLARDLSVQTVACSRIAADKMQHFSISIVLIAFGTVVLTLSLVAELFLRSG